MFDRLHSFFCIEWIDGDGRITAGDATSFFAKSLLSRSELKQAGFSFHFSVFFDSIQSCFGSILLLHVIISYGVLCFLKVWAIADSKRQGFLGLKEFITAMQVSISYPLFWLL